MWKSSPPPSEVDTFYSFLLQPWCLLSQEPFLCLVILFLSNRSHHHHDPHNHHYQLTSLCLLHRLDICHRCVYAERNCRLVGSTAVYCFNIQLLWNDCDTVNHICILIIIIIIIFINCNWAVTRWQWLFYMYTKYEIGY